MRSTLLFLSPLSTLVSANTHHAAPARRHFAWEAPVTTQTLQVNGQAGLSGEGNSESKSIEVGAAGQGGIHGEAAKSFSVGGTGNGQTGVHGEASKSFSVGNAGGAQSGISGSIHGGASVEGGAQGGLIKSVTVDHGAGGGVATQAGVSGTVEGDAKGESSIDGGVVGSIEGQGQGQAGLSGEAGAATTGTVVTDVGLTGSADAPAYTGPPVSFSPEAEGADFVSPFTNGGNMSFSTTNDKGIYIKPEPINVIISAASAFPSLKDADNEVNFYARGGFAQYLSGLDISAECLGFGFSAQTFAAVNGPDQEPVNFVYRENFRNGDYGTCDAATKGGLTVRGWRQNVTGAWFLGLQITGGINAFHVPLPNGYDLGRDDFTGRAQRGGKDYLGCIWPPAKIEKLDGLVHADAGGTTGLYNHEIGIDGSVSVITVSKPVCPPGIVIPGGRGNNTNGTWSSHGPSAGLTPITPPPVQSPPPPPPSSTPPKNMPKSKKNGASSSVVALGSVFAGLLVAIFAI